MKIYQVGGAVRDRLLNKKSQDNDFVVVGSGIEEMLQKGFRQVGKKFPVFLHPETKEEYALARKEIKTGPGHGDFSFVFSADVSLREDLERRDFTCNALAVDLETGELSDYFNGRKDIENHLLRHVNSDHFPEDPLRVLRMCRFAAQLDFDVAPETMDLARKMTKAGMLHCLSAERIWKEFEKALSCDGFFRFVETMRDCGALKDLVPELDKLWQVPERFTFHPEGTTGEHLMLALKQSATESALVKFGVLMHDIGKGQTPTEVLPAHHGHDKKGEALIFEICKRFKIPNKYRDFAVLSAVFHMRFYQLPENKFGKQVWLAESVTKKHESDLEDFISVCRADFFGTLAERTPKDIQVFELSAQRLRKIASLLCRIKAEQMPNFCKMPKDETFALKYREFKLNRLQKLLKEEPLKSSEK
jgi:tRNA nucleotidyltransferase (CCA-adding enzyme)